MLTRQTAADRPFALPNRELVTTVVDLPFPCSTNALWAYNRAAKRPIHPSKAYQTWKKSADALALTQKVGRMRCIEGPFAAELMLQDGRRSDADNAIKCVLDRAKAWFLIADDRYCRKVTIEFVASHRVRHGARLTLVELA